MRTAHSKPVAAILNESHFNKIVEHLQQSPLELSAPNELIQKVITIAPATKIDTLNLRSIIYKN